MIETVADHADLFWLISTVLELRNVDRAIVGGMGWNIVVDNMFRNDRNYWGSRGLCQGS